MTRDSGYRITKETTAFIRPGTTTRADLIENLGPPLFELKDANVLAYSWGKVRPTGARRVQNQEMNPQSGQPGYSTPQPPPLEETSAVEAKRWIYCVALDSEDHVTRAETLRLEGEPSLESAVRRWIGAPK